MTLLILSGSPVTQLCDMIELNHLGLFLMRSTKLLSVWFPSEGRSTGLYIHSYSISSYWRLWLPILGYWDNPNDDRKQVSKAY